MADHKKFPRAQMSVSILRDPEYLDLIRHPGGIAAFGTFCALIIAAKHLGLKDGRFVSTQLASSASNLHSNRIGSAARLIDRICKQHGGKPWIVFEDDGGLLIRQFSKWNKLTNWGGRRSKRQLGGQAGPQLGGQDGATSDSDSDSDTNKESSFSNSGTQWEGISRAMMASGISQSNAERLATRWAQLGLTQDRLTVVLEEAEGNADLTMHRIVDALAARLNRQQQTSQPPTTSGDWHPWMQFTEQVLAEYPPICVGLRGEARQAVAMALAHIHGRDNQPDGPDGATATVEHLIERVKAFRRATDGADDRYIPHAARWFREQGYEGSEAAWAKTGRDRQQGADNGTNRNPSRVRAKAGKYAHIPGGER